jgi:hypothetical protein
LFGWFVRTRSKGILQQAKGNKDGGAAEVRIERRVEVIRVQSSLL